MAHPNPMSEQAMIEAREDLASSSRRGSRKNGVQFYHFRIDAIPGCGGNGGRVFQSRDSRVSCGRQLNVLQRHNDGIGGSDECVQFDRDAIRSGAECRCGVNKFLCSSHNFLFQSVDPRQDGFCFVMFTIFPHRMKLIREKIDCCRKVFHETKS